VDIFPIHDPPFVDAFRDGILQIDGISRVQKGCHTNDPLPVEAIWALTLLGSSPLEIRSPLLFISFDDLTKGSE
jgi:hypothetical protein